MHHHKACLYPTRPAPKRLLTKAKAFSHTKQSNILFCTSINKDDEAVPWESRYSIMHSNSLVNHSVKITSSTTIINHIKLASQVLVLPNSSNASIHQGAGKMDESPSSPATFCCFLHNVRHHPGQNHGDTHCCISYKVSSLEVRDSPPISRSSIFASHIPHLQLTC